MESFHHYKTNMKKYTLIIILSIFIILFIITLTEIRTKNTHVDEWSTFTDQINNWEIKYPSTITNIAITDDTGIRNWSNNIIFHNKDNWLFGVYVAKTEYVDVKSYIESLRDTYIKINGNVTINDMNFTTGLDPEIPSEKIFLTIKNGRVFIFHTNNNAPTMQILEGFKTTE